MSGGGWGPKNRITTPFLTRTWLRSEQPRSTPRRSPVWTAPSGTTMPGRGGPFEATQGRSCTLMGSAWLTVEIRRAIDARRLDTPSSSLLSDPGLEPQAARKLLARVHAELAEHLSEVVLDRARADEQLSGDLPVGVSLRSEPGDLGFPRRELA
jgi:hypothetical protein